MAYNIVVQVSSQGEGTIDKIEQKLDDTTQAAGRASAALKDAGDSAAAFGGKVTSGVSSADAEMDAFARKLEENLKRASTPQEQFSAQLKIIDLRLVEGQISMEQYDAALDKLHVDLAEAQAQAARMSEALNAETIEQATGKLGETAEAAAKTSVAIGAIGESATTGMAKAEAAYGRAKAVFDEQMAGIDRLAAEGKMGQDVYGQWAKAFEKTFKSSLVGDVKAFADALERVNAPVRRYEQDLAALDVALHKEQITLEQYNEALAKAQKRAESGGALTPMQGPTFDPNQAGRGMTAELQREHDLLEQIQAPMLEYQAQLKALQALLAKDAISLEQYDAQLAKAQKQAERGGALAPVQGPKQQTVPTKPPASGGGDDGSAIGDVLHAVAPQFGQGGMLLSQFASGGAVAAAGAAALVVELKNLSDEYTTLANKVERFSTDTMSADDILHQQLDLSKELHSSLEATEELYVRVRESTHQLNLSQKQQLTLAHDLGVELAAEGHGAEEAASLVRRLGLAFETGTISGRELRSIFKQFPEIGQELADALGHTQAQLLQMANKGQLSAQELIDAFHKVAPEAEKTVDRLHETYSTKFGHLWDEIKLSVGGAIDKINEADSDQAKVAEGIYQRHLHTIREAKRQLDQELSKNSRTADIATAATSVGIDIGPFDKDQADKITEVRMTAREAGVDIADAFEAAKAKAQLYGAKIDEIREQHAAKEIADDAKRIYDALHGANDLLDTQFKRWRDLASQVQVVTKALEQRTSLDTAAGRVSQEQRDLQLQLANLKTDQTVSEYGKSMVGYAQGLNTARSELEALNRAHRDGVIAGDAYRQKYDQLMTTLNDGRLPAVIKMWESFTIPLRDWRDNLTAVNVLFEQGRISLLKYDDELTKLAAAGKDFAQQQYDESRVPPWMQKRWLDQTRDAFGGLARVIPEARAEYERWVDAQKNILGPDLLTGSRDVQHSLAVQQRLRDEYESTAAAQRLERGRQLANEFVAPIVKYEETLKDIEASKAWGNTDQQLSILQRRAKETMNAELEALEAQKGPMGQYEATLRKLRDQLEVGDISQRKYTEGLDKAKETLLEATGAAKTFQGAMQINWIRAKQDADSFGASVANMAVADFGKLNDAIVTAANNGEVSWSKMADSMIQDLERIFLKMEETKLINWLVGIGSSAAGGDSTMDAGLVDEFAKGMGYANGGSFMVGGSGGTDSKYVGMRVTPGEMVTVSTPAQQQSTRNAQRQAPTQVVVQPQIHNHYDNSMMVSALSTPIGQSAVMNVLRANPEAVRMALGIR